MFYSPEDAISWGRLYQPFKLTSTSDFDTNLKTSRYFEYDKKDLWASVYYSVKRAIEPFNSVDQKIFIDWCNHIKIHDIKKRHRVGQKRIYDTVEQCLDSLTL